MRPGSKIAELVGSSQYEAVADDTLKDEDNVAWVMLLHPAVKDEWIERIRWIRLADRLAENELVTPGNTEFQKFYNNWQRLLQGEMLEPECAYHQILTQIADRWSGKFASSLERRSLQAWERFLTATAYYHQPDLVIDTLVAHTEMLEALAGSCFQILPFLTEPYWQLAIAFGAVDQFFNNLRDLQEDARQGICYLPATVLEEFGVTRHEILSLTACQKPNYQRMMQFWLDEYLPQLLQRTQPLLLAQDLHPSWQLWRDWSFHRYRRIEQVFRDCQFDYTQFPQQYWTKVQQELPTLLAQMRPPPPPSLGRRFPKPLLRRHKRSHFSLKLNLKTRVSQLVLANF